jgi:hypothetical protein
MRRRVSVGRSPVYEKTSALTSPGLGHSAEHKCGAEPRSGNESAAGYSLGEERGS